MRTPRYSALSAMALFAGLPAAQAEPLSVINVGAAAVNCVYDAACGFMVNDTVATILIGISGRAALQTRTFTGGAGSPAAGKNGYQYRVNLTGAVGSRCVSALKLPFGTIVKLPYTRQPLRRNLRRRIRRPRHHRSGGRRQDRRYDHLHLQQAGLRRRKPRQWRVEPVLRADGGRTAEIRCRECRRHRRSIRERAGAHSTCASGSAESQT